MYLIYMTIQYDNTIRLITLRHSKQVSCDTFKYYAARNSSLNDQCKSLRFDPV